MITALVTLPKGQSDWSGGMVGEAQAVQQREQGSRGERHACVVLTGKSEAVLRLV